MFSINYVDFIFTASQNHHRNDHEEDQHEYQQHCQEQGQHNVEYQQYQQAVDFVVLDCCLGFADRLLNDI